MRNLYLTIEDAAKQSLNNVLKGCSIAVICLLSAVSTQAQTFPNYEVEPNNNAAVATPIASNPAKMRGYIYPNADEDFYSFTATAGDRVFAATQTAFSSTASTNSRLELRASDGVTVIEFDLADGTFGSNSSSIAGALIPTTGTYYLRVSHTSATSQLRPYDLYLRVQSGLTTAEVEPNNSNLTANVLPANGWVNGVIDPAADADFYSINLAAGETVFLGLDLDPERDATSWNGRLGFGLFGDLDNQILVANDGSSTSPNSEAFFFTALNAGTYYVYVDQPSGSGGATFTYNLSVSKFAAESGYTNYAYTGGATPLADAGPPTISTITIADSKRIKDISVRLNLTHTFMLDLDVTLTSPDGNTVHLFSDIGASGAQTMMDLMLNDNNAIPPSFTVMKGVAYQPELQGFLDYFKGMNTAGTWTLTVYDDGSPDVGTLNAWSIDILEDTTPLTPLNSYAVYSTDFELNDGGFTSSGTANEWAWGVPATAATSTANPVAGFTTAHSGINVWKTDLTGTYNNSSNQILESPSIDLTSAVGPLQLNWAMKYQMESASFDTLKVYVEEVGGGGMQQVVFRWYGATQTAGLGNPLVNVPQSAGWGVYHADVSAFAGKVVRFKVNLGSDNTVNFGGVAIDDVQVFASCQPVVVNLGADVTACPGSAVMLNAGVFSSYAWSTLESTQTISVSADGSYAVTVTDANGCTGVDTVAVVFSDVIAPVITCGSDVTVSNDAGNCSAVVTYTLPTATDNCSNVQLLNNQSFESGDFTDWDTLGPPTGASCDEAFSVYTGNYDPCGFGLGFGVDFTPQAGTFAAHAGFDGSGPLVRELRQQVVLPTVLATAQLKFKHAYYVDLLSFCGGCTGSRVLDVDVLDSLGSTVLASLYNLTFVPGQTYSSPFTQIDLNVLSALTSLAGQKVNLSFKLTVPEFFVGPGAYAVDDVQLLVTPGAVPVNQIAGLPSGAAFPVGTTVNTFVAADASGNTDTCSFTVTVQDTTLPVITCPANITASNDAGNCSAVVNFADATATTACGSCATTLPSNVNAAYLGSFEGHHYLLSNTTADWNTANAAAQALGGYLAVINNAGENAFLTTAIGASGNPWIGGFQNPLNLGYSEPLGGWEWVDGSPFTYTNWSGGEPNDASGLEHHLQFYGGSGAWNDFDQNGALSYVVEFSCPVLITQTDGPASGSAFSVGTDTVEYTAISGFGGASVTCSFTVTVQDTSKPVISCPTDIAVSNEVGTCGAVVAFADPTATENCDNELVSNSSQSWSNSGQRGVFFDITNVSSQTISIDSIITASYSVSANNYDFSLYFTNTASSYAGEELNAGSWTLNNNVTINVPAAPNFSTVSGFFAIPLSSPLTLAAGESKGVYIVANTGYGGGPVSYLSTLGGYSGSQTVTDGIVSFTGGKAIDGLFSGNIFGDGSPSNFRLFYGSVHYSMPISITQTAGLSSGSTFPVGVTTNTFVATDASGNTDTCSFTVTVADTSKPTAVCQDATVYLVAGSYTLTGAEINNGSSDLCSSGTCSTFPASFTCADLGAHTVTLTVSDTSGNSSTCTALVTVADTSTPSAVCQDVTIYLDATGNATLAASQVNNGSSVGCGSPSITVAPDTFNCSNIGANTVTLTVTDASNNVSTCTAVVTVLDTVAPVLTCASNISVDNGTATCGAVVTYTAPSASDACAGSATVPVTATQTGLPVSIPDNNSTGVTNVLNVTQFGGGDMLGGAVTLNSVCFNINHTWVGDLIVSLKSPDGTIVPLINRPGRATSATSGFGCSGDNVDMCVDLGVGADAESVCSNLPAISGTYKAHEGANLNAINNGSAANGNWELIVSDNGGGDFGSLQAWSLNFSQAVSSYVAVNQIAGLASGATFPVGTTTNTFVATDASGNTDTCSFTVTVADTTKPTAVCKNFTLQLDVNGNGTLLSADVNNGSSDNCGIASMSVSPSAFTCANLGANTVTLTVTDTAGNSSTCTATVTVNSYAATLTGAPLATTQLINEGFAVVPPPGWIVTNNSSPLGLATWFQGNPNVFPAASAPANSYAGVNFNSTTGNNTISNWLILPNITMKDGDVFTFRTRAVDDFADRLQVRMSTNGTSTDVGNTNVSVGDFSNLLLDINPTLVTGVYPTSWTQFTITVSGLGVPTSGRFAFRYFVTSGGPSGSNSDYLGIDDVVYTSLGDTICVGEPADLTVNVAGGVSPYTVVYSDGLGNTTVNSYTTGSNIPVSPLATTTYTLVSVTDANGCTAAPASGSATIAVYPVVTVAATADQAVCNNETTTAVAFTGAATNFSWTNSEPSIGLAASGSGNIAAFTATNAGGTPVVAEIIVTPTDAVTGCVGTPDTFTITVNPNLNVNSTQDLTLCVNQNSPVVVFTGTASAYNWTNDNTAIGLAASGTGDIASFVATNTGTTPLVATVVVVPTGNACPVVNDTFTITVNPGPVAVCQDLTVYLDASGNANITAAEVDNGSTAGCGVQSLTVSPNTFNCGATGANTVTLTLTDSSGNVVTCQATVTVLDTSAPVITCPSDIAISNEQGVCGATVSYPQVTFADNCGGIVTNNVTATQTGLPVSIPDNNPTGVTNVLNVSQFGGGDMLGGAVTLNSVCFNINHTWVGDLIVSLKSPDGTIVPLINRPGRATSATSGFGCSGNDVTMCVDLGVGADAESVCSNLPAISGTYKAHEGANLNAINNGSAANGNWELIVSDNGGSDFGTIQAWSLNFTQTQLLGGSVTQIAGLASGSTFPVGTTTNTFVATDASGNTDTCSFNVVVSDTEAPTFGVQNCTGGVFTIQITDAGVGFMDEVDWTLTDASNTVIASGGGYTTLAVTEVVNGTTGPYTFNITSGGSFDDNVANYSISCNGNELASGIVIGAFWGGSGVASSADICCIDGFCSTDVEVFAAQGDCDAVVNYVVPLAADNCPGVTLTQTSGLPSGATFPSGNTTITYEAEDAAGNVSTCTFKVTVFETTPPIAVCQDVTAYLDATGNVTITAAQADGGSTDNCGIDSLSLSRYTFSCRDVGVHTIQLFVTDLSGNLDACNLTVTILDTIAYQIICPSDVVVSNDMGQCGAVVNFNAPTTYDNCADTVRLSHSFNDDILDGNSVACVNGFGHADNSYLRVYDLNQFGYGIGNDFDVTNVQFGVELAVGAGGSQPAVVNLYTLSGPLTYANLTLVATQNITIPDQSETLFNLPITATIPGGSTLVVELFTPNGQSVGNFFYIGSNSYSQTDLSYGVFPDCGPYSEPTDMAVVGYPSMEIILNVLSVPSETVTQIAGLPSGSTFPVGTSVVTFAADNGSGSTDTCSFNVIVNDTELPIAVCQNVTVYLDTNGSASITTADVNNGSTDNCVIDTITLSKEVFNCSEIGVNTVTLSVTDTSGNVGVCTATITVLDTTAPVAVCKNATVYLDANGAVTVLGTDVDGGATDNCAVSSITVSPNSFTCADRDSTYQVLVTFADASGNASSCNATVTIADTLRPVALCQNLTIQLDSTGNATITVAQINNGSYDNCNIASVTISQSVFTCANIGANTVTLSVADSSGNVGTCDAIVTVDPSATIDSFTLSNYNGYNVSCYGSADGTATVHTTSVFPVTYLWSNGQTSQTATALAAGQYFVTVTAGTCEFVDSVTLTQPDSLTINPVLSDYNGFGVRCFGSNDGTITLNVTGGVPTYNYAWPSSSAIGNSYTANGLLPGVYNITVTDLNGCTKVTSPELTQPTQVHTSISAVAPKCNGGTDGTATVVASGGTSVFTYLWNTVPAQTSATATGLGAGTYTVTVSDGNGCTSVNSITIAQPAALVAIAQGTSNFNGYGVSCFGGNNGTGSVTVIGGTSPFSYAWSGGTVSGNTVTGLASGTFTVTITDANGCSAVDSITVTQPSRITATATVTSNFNGAQISCNGATDGQLTANGNGGVAPYFYEWNTTPVQTSKVATGVGAGTYIVTITDLNGCTDTASVTISAPAAITATGAVTSNFNGFGVSCFGGNNGAATVTATGGTGTLNYAWPSASGVGNTANGTGLAAGTYVVTVTDTNACSATVSITVTQPTEITAVPSVVDAKCFGANDGKAWVTVSGGVPGYTYSWSTSPAQTTDTASNLLAGTYTVVVSDQNGCSSTITVVVNEPALLVADANGEGVTCPNGNDGEATATATGGTAPYSFAWNTTPPQTGTTATGLTEGTYTVTVTDANGCTATDTAVIIVKYPTLPTATLSGGGAVCADEPRPDVFVTFTGFPPYNFTLSNGTTTTNYTGVTQSPFVVAGASAGTYTVTNFSDAHCTGTVSGTAVVKVNPVPSVVVTGGGFVCDGERLPSVEVEFTGTAPWDVVIRIPEGRDTLITNVTASPLVFNPESEGFYIVRSVSDSNGCVAFNLNATKEVGFFLLPLVDAGEPKTVDKGFSVKLDGKVITAYGGVVNYEWTPDTSLNNAFIEQPMARPFETTLYTLTATDKNNCKASDTVTVTVSDRIIIDVINVFTPDGDGVNEFFVIRNRDAFDVLELTILNRWEQIIYESDNYANNWDGTWKGKPVDDGTYYYVIKDVASGKIVKGAVTILRNNE